MQIPSLSYQNTFGALVPPKHKWQIYTPDGFRPLIKEFAKTDTQAKELVELASVYQVDLSLQNVIGDCFPFKAVIDKICKLLDIATDKSPKIYRFIGESEYKALKRGEQILPQRNSDKIDVTINPELNWNKYRITYKQTPKFSILGHSDSKIVDNICHENEGYFYLQGGYNSDDVECIEIYDGEKFVKELNDIIG